MADNSILTKTKLSSFKIDPRLITHLTKIDLVYATKIQQKTIPALLNSRDALIRSETGSGKTLAYLIPLINSLTTNRGDRSQGTLALILAPTRELSCQIFEILRKILIPFNNIVPGTLMGGEKKKSEKARLRKGVSVLVATPGRLLDHLENTKSFSVNKLSWLILDEADRLLDLGFERTIKSILAILKAKNNDFESRRNVLISATLTKKISSMALMALKNPIFITAEEEKIKAPESVSNEQRASTIDIKDFEIPNKIKQHWAVVEPGRRLIVLIALLAKFYADFEKCKTIIFVSTCDEVDFLFAFFDQIGEFFELITKRKLDKFKLHGDMPQKDRTSVFFNFCKSETAILFCTDIAERGLDLPKVNFIVQYDAPITPVVYIHRIGRTARLDRIGKSIIFLMPSEIEYLNVLKNQKRQMAEITPLSIIRDFGRLVNEGQKKAKRSKNEINNFCAEEFLATKVYSIVSSDRDLSELGEKAFHQFLRSYATFPAELKRIFHPKYINHKHLCKSFGIRETMKRKHKPQSLSKPHTISAFKKRRINNTNPQDFIQAPKNKNFGNNYEKAVKNAINSEFAA